jgi:hypothetical protein
MYSTLNYKNFHSKEKTLIKQDIFWEQYDNQPTWKDIKHIEFQDDDTIRISYEEYNEDGSGDSWYVSIERWVEETDEEFEERLIDIEEEKKRMKNMRYKSYLKLKVEFEPEVKCLDRMGVELESGDVVDVQQAGKHTIYRGKDGELYFKPYGKEEKVKDYFSTDIEKVL